MKAHPASYGSGMPFGISKTASNTNTGVAFYPPGSVCKVTAGNTITGGDMCYVDNTGSGMVCKYTYTGSAWIPTVSTGDSHYTDSWWAQMRDFHAVVGVALTGAASGSTFWILFSPIL